MPGATTNDLARAFKPPRSAPALPHNDLLSVHPRAVRAGPLPKAIRMKISYLLAPAGVLGLAALVVLPSRQVAAFTTIGGSLPLDQRHFRIFNNFSDAATNNNQTPEPDIPGSLGAVLCLRKAAYEWNSVAYGSGTSDPLQSQLGGETDANFDYFFLGEIGGFGAGEGNRVAALSANGNGVLAFMSPGGGGISNGWNIRFYDGGITWADGPASPGGAFDLQQVGCHEFGHALGLGHSGNGGATMVSGSAPGQTFKRSINSDDIAGVQFIYGVKPASKPTIAGVSVNGSSITITGTNFDATDNTIWFSKEFPATKPVLEVTGIASTNGGTQISVTAPAGSATGDIAVRIPGNGGDKLSNPHAVVISETGDPINFYCVGKVSSAGCFATLTTTDPNEQPVSGSSNYALIANDLQGQKNSIFFGGNSGPASLPFSGGTLCVNPPTFRTAIQSTAGSGPNSCDGSVFLVVNDGNIIPFGPDAGPGNSSWMQLWYRDPGNGAGNLGTALSGGVQFDFQ